MEVEVEVREPMEGEWFAFHQNSFHTYHNPTSHLDEHYDHVCLNFVLL